LDYVARAANHRCLHAVLNALICTPSHLSSLCHAASMYPNLRECLCQYSTTSCTSHTSHITPRLSWSTQCLSGTCSAASTLRQQL